MEKQTDVHSLSSSWELLNRKDMTGSEFVEADKRVVLFA